MCSPDATHIQMTDEFKEAFLRGFNEKRSLVAEGRLDGVFWNKPAARMATLVSELMLILIQSKFARFDLHF